MGACAAGVAVSTSASTSTTTTSTTKKATATTTTTTTTNKSKTKTSSNAEETSGPWSISIYSEEDCEGDYYLVEGHNPHTTRECISIHSGIKSTYTGAGTWCQWYTDGGFNHTDCDDGPNLEVKSWHITTGICTVYDTETCEPNGLSQAYASWIRSGCNNADNWSPEHFGGLKCSHEQ